MKSTNSTFFAAIFLAFAGTAYAAPPDWLADPGNSRWAVCGGETNGVTVDMSDGTLKKVPGGLQAFGPNGQPSNIYVKTGPWEKFHPWLGNKDVLFTIRYFDGDKGTMLIRYDSSDFNVRVDPNSIGAWRVPDQYPDGVPLTGSQTWKALSLRLPLAFFTKRVNGGDLRIEGFGKDFILGGVAFTRVPKGPELPVKQALFTESPQTYDQATGEFWTESVEPFDVAQWRSVTFDLPATVDAQYEYSTDSGKSWTAFDPKNGLSKIPVTGGGKDHIQFHIKGHSHDGVTPFHFGGGVLAYQAGPHNTWTIENARMKVEVDPFGIKSIFDKKTGQTVSDAPPFHAALVNLMMKKPGASPPSRAIFIMACWRNAKSAALRIFRN